MSAPTLPSDDTTRALQTARRYVGVAYNNACMLEYDNQDEAKLLRLIDKGLDTLRRERDAALGVAKGAADILAAAVSENASLKEQLAASERTCAELRASIENAVVGMNTLSAQSVQLVDENALLLSANRNCIDWFNQAIARAEAAERTVNNWREAMRQLGEVNEYELDQIEQRATEIGNKKG